MDEINDNNKIIENENDQDEVEFNYDFVNTPWDDRTKRNRAAIVLLLIFIFVLTMALVVYNFYMHYNGFDPNKDLETSLEINCYRVKFDELKYVARIHSAVNYEVLCLGAVVSPSSILANGICAEFGQMRMYMGAMTKPRCRKGFSVDLSEGIHHPGVVSSKLVLLSSYENIEECSVPIAIGDQLDINSQVQIIGRPFTQGSSLSRQHVKLANDDLKALLKIDTNYTILVKDLARCPVRPGDLMIQNGKLFGLAAYQRNKLAYFAALNPIRKKLKEIDDDVVIASF